MIPVTEEPTLDLVGKVAGFSLHAGVAIKANQRDKLERLCRYIARPAISNKRLSLTPQSKIRYELKTPYRDGTTHVFFEPLDFVSKLVALVPLPRVNLKRFFGVFALNSNHRKQVINQKISIKKTKIDTKTEVEKRASMNWGRRLKRAFHIDIDTCEKCGGFVKAHFFSLSTAFTLAPFLRSIHIPSSLASFAIRYSLCRAIHKRIFSGCAKEY